MATGSSRVRPAVRAFMMSLLAVRKIQLGDQFAAKNPNPWLVWEPGVWQPAKGAGAPTMIAGAGMAQRPAQGDALCFELLEPRSIKVGRAPECEVVINDATVSREHLVLEPQGGRWAARIAGLTNAATLDGQPLSGIASELRPGARLKLGDVVLTYCDSAELVKRLDLTIKAASKP